MFSEPIMGEKFFGREEVLELLNKRVMALKDGYRQNIALTGQSLSGKSSIILHFLHTVKSEGFIPVYVEIIKEPFKSFSNKFIATILYNALNKLGHPVEADMPRLLELGGKHLPRTCQIIKEVNASIDKGDFDEAYMRLLGLTSSLKEEAGLSCVVILDEFDNLEQIGIKNPFLNFGKVIMVQKDTMYIVSSSRDEAIKKIISEKLSLLFGNFEIIRVANFDAKTAERFIDMKFAGLETGASLKKFLIMFTDGNPFYLDRITAKARQIALEEPSSCIDYNMAATAILETVYHANGVIHQYLMNFTLTILDTKSREDYLAIMISIAEGRNTLVGIARGLKAKQGDVSAGLNRLMELGLLAKSGVFYSIEDSLLSFWLTAVYKRRKELLVDGAFDRMELFRKDVVQHISGYIRECEKSAAQKMAEIFNLFSGELVCIDSKQIRLPHFTKVDLKVLSHTSAAITASYKDSCWLAHVYERNVNENDIVNFIKNIRASEYKISNRILLAFGGIEENAKLLAKELKISIWDYASANKLLTYYGMRRMVIL